MRLPSRATDRAILERAGAVAVALSLGLGGCRSPEQREVETTLAAVTRLREAGPSDRQDALDALDGMKPVVPEAASARSACVRAYRALGETQRLVAEAKGPPVDREKLAAADRELDAARSGLTECTTAATALRHRLAR